MKRFWNTVQPILFFLLVLYFIWTAVVPNLLPRFKGVFVIGYMFPELYYNGQNTTRDIVQMSSWDNRKITYYLKMGNGKPFAQYSYDFRNKTGSITMSNFQRRLSSNQTKADDSHIPMLILAGGTQVAIAGKMLQVSGAYSGCINGPCYPEPSMFDPVAMKFGNGYILLWYIDQSRPRPRLVQLALQKQNGSTFMTDSDINILKE